MYQKAGAGLAAGGLGALVGSPADLSLIRMQADSTLPEAQKRHYKGVGDALTRIVKDEGAIGLFRGAGPTVTRAMALNMGMLASNDQVRDCEATAYAHQGNMHVRIVTCPWAKASVESTSRAPKLVAKAHEWHVTSATRALRQ